jgi:hypothetical protein
MAELQGGPPDESGPHAHRHARPPDRPAPHAHRVQVGGEAANPSLEYLSLSLAFGTSARESPGLRTPGESPGSGGTSPVHAPHPVHPASRQSGVDTPSPALRYSCSSQSRHTPVSTISQGSSSPGSGTRVGMTRAGKTRRPSS